MDKIFYYLSPYLMQYIIWGFPKNELWVKDSNASSLLQKGRESWHENRASNTEQGDY